MIRALLPVFFLCFSMIVFPALASANMGEKSANFTHTGAGIFAVIIFILSYVLVVLEEKIRLKKSVPVITAAGIIWMLVSISFESVGDIDTATKALQQSILDFAKLFLFLLTAMTFINSMQIFNVFEAIRAKIIRMKLTFRGVFWITGFLAFAISSIANNLTTALVMGTIVLAVANNNRKFITLSCINIVVASNAGGVFSPFGDITTLMVWQSEKVHFTQFFSLLLPSVVNWITPAIFMSFAIPKSKPEGFVGDAKVADGGYAVIALFFLSIILAVFAHNFLHLPPVIGMMAGFGLLQLYSWGYNQKITFTRAWRKPVQQEKRLVEREKRKFDVFHAVENSEWDTLLFFYGVVLCVGGLGTLGYMTLLSNVTYTQIDATWANVLIGILSSVVDNIPVMFSVLTMDPDMGVNQWLLATLTTGVGGSILSVGSAAGVAMMGQARGYYTFFSHLKWVWAIALGYGASIICHLYFNGF